MSDKVKYYLYGDMKHILMFSYPLYLEKLNEFYEEVDDPSSSDVIFISYSQDIAWDKFPEFYRFQKKLNAKIILLCEEPLWDLSWSSNICTISGKTYATKFESKVQISHLGYTDTKIFEYKKIPYFLTTNDLYFKNYLTYIDKIKSINISEILKSKKYDVSGIYARRTVITNNEFYVGDDVNNKCLHLFKNQLADDLKNNNDDLRCDFFGVNNSSYEGLTDITIYDSSKFHQAKLDWCFKNSKFLFALENTMHKSYVTEKIFDAVATLSIPIYCLPPTEDIKFKGINLYDFLFNDYETLFNVLIKKIKEFNVESTLKENLKILENYYLKNYEISIADEISDRVVKLNENVNRILNED